MRFIRCSLALLITSILLGACAGAAKKDEPDAEIAPDNQELISTDPVIETPFVAIPKPASPDINIPKSARNEFAAAKKAMQSERWQDAADQLIIMSETYPELAGVYVNLGIAYEKLEKYQDAENAYRFAIEKNALNFDAYTNLGVLLRSQGKFSDAEAVYLEALNLWPHHQPSLINLGVLYDMYLARLPEALANYELAQKLNEEEDRQLKGWIVDLQRRIPK